MISMNPAYYEILSHFFSCFIFYPQQQTRTASKCGVKHTYIKKNRESRSVGVKKTHKLVWKKEVHALYEGVTDV